MTGEILCVGTELLLGDIMNTNAAFLARELAALGISVYHQTVVGDNGGRLREAVSLALSRSDLLVMTGGLGRPTTTLPKRLPPRRWEKSWYGTSRPMTGWRPIFCVPAG